MHTSAQKMPVHANGKKTEGFVSINELRYDRPHQFDHSSRIIFENLTFNASLGEIAVILGPSGCGKSTLLKLIAGLEPRKGSGAETSGELLVDGKLPKEYLMSGELAFVPQDPTLMPQWTVEENICALATVDKIMARKQMRQLFEESQVKMLLPRYPSQLSGGQKARIALVRATVKPTARLLLLDESFGGLDVRAKYDAYKMVRLWISHQPVKPQRCCILVTHDIHEAVVLGDRIYVMTGRSLSKQMTGNPAALEAFVEQSPELVSPMNPGWIAGNKFRQKLGLDILRMLIG